MKTLFIIGFTALSTYLLSQFTKNQKPKVLKPNEGRLTPGKVSAWITIILGFFMALGGIALCFVALTAQQEDNELWGGVTLFLLGSSIAGFMSPSLFSVHDIIWDEAGVEGEKSIFGPTLGWKRHKIKWNEVIKRGETATQYWYLETQDKRRVYWSYLYSGYGEFDKVIHQKCPNLNN